MRVRRRCYQRRPRVLPMVAAGATMASHRCCKAAAAATWGTEFATTGHRRCYKRTPALLEPADPSPLDAAAASLPPLDIAATSGHWRCYKRIPALLQPSNVSAASPPSLDAAATSGHWSCYKRPLAMLLVQVQVGAATSVERWCCQPSTAVLRQAVAGDGASG